MYMMQILVVPELGGVNNLLKIYLYHEFHTPTKQQIDHLKNLDLNILAQKKK